LEEKIKSNRRRILRGGTAFSLVQLLFVLLLGWWIVSDYRNISGWATLFLCFNLAALYFATGSGMRVILWAGQVTPVYPGGLREFEGLVDDICLATGLCNMERYCSAASLGFLK
jgi:hypothetical protein